MNDRKDDIDQVIQHQLKNEGQKLQSEYEASGSPKMPEHLKDDIRKKLQSQIEEHELEQLYAKLPERDREALKLGRQMMDQKEESEKIKDSEKIEDVRDAEAFEETKKVVYRKKRRKLYISVAAIAILVLAFGMTSLGGAERIIAIMKSVVGEREVTQIDSNKENKIISGENEEEAYQKVKDAFGVEPVKILGHPNDIYFKSIEIDELMQTAELLYKCQEENVVYIVSAAYADTSYGVDVEDEVTDEYVVEVKGRKIDVKEYKISTNMKRYSARFSHKGLEYFLMGTMNRQKFEEIVKSLYFLG